MSQVELPSYDQIALVFQGGGALGAYQAGVYQGLAEAGIMPQSLAGISIGAVNAAIIAGNSPNHRVDKLRQFWETISTPNKGWSLLPWFESNPLNATDLSRMMFSMWGGLSAIFDGQDGFFKPRFPPPQFFGKGDPTQTSYYDISELKCSLEQFVDFDLLNSKHCEMQIAVGAVNVRTGNFVYFDNRKERLRAEHFMASGAIPPAFPAVEIDGEYYWDGGIVSNTPLSFVLGENLRANSLIFQVDLWSAKGDVPQNMLEVADRIQEIRFSSRTRLVTYEWMERLETARLLADLLELIPAAQRKGEAYEAAQAMANLSKKNVVHLIYQDSPHETQNKDFQFSLTTMRDHWQRGLTDINATLHQPHLLQMPSATQGFTAHDVHAAAREHHLEWRGGSLNSVKR